MGIWKFMCFVRTFCVLLSSVPEQQRGLLHTCAYCIFYKREMTSFEYLVMFLISFLLHSVKAAFFIWHQFCLLCSSLTSLILHFFQLLSLPVSWFYSSSFPTLFNLMSRDFQRGHLYLENDQKKCLINARCGKYREISEMKMEIYVMNRKKQVLFRCAHN